MCLPCIKNSYALELYNLTTYLEQTNDPFVDEIKYFEECNAPTKSKLLYKISGLKFRDKNTCYYEHFNIQNQKKTKEKFSLHKNNYHQLI